RPIAARVPFCRTGAIRRLASRDEGRASAICCASRSAFDHIVSWDVLRFVAEVFPDAFSDDAPERDWHGIADHATECLEMNGGTVGDERIGFWKSLQNCPFS